MASLITQENQVSKFSSYFNKSNRPFIFFFFTATLFFFFKYLLTVWSKLQEIPQAGINILVDQNKILIMSISLVIASLLTGYFKGFFSIFFNLKFSWKKLFEFTLKVALHIFIVVILSNILGFVKFGWPDWSFFSFLPFLLSYLFDILMLGIFLCLVNSFVHYILIDFKFINYSSDFSIDNFLVSVFRLLLLFSFLVCVFWMIIGPLFNDSKIGLLYSLSLSFLTSGIFIFRVINQQLKFSSYLDSMKNFFWFDFVFLVALFFVFDLSWSSMSTVSIFTSQLSFTNILSFSSFEEVNLFNLPVFFLYLNICFLVHLIYTTKFWQRSANLYYKNSVK